MWAVLFIRDFLHTKHSHSCHKSTTLSWICCILAFKNLYTRFPSQAWKILCVCASLSTDGACESNKSCMFFSSSTSCRAPRGQWKCQGHYIGSVLSERLKVSSCAQQDIQGHCSLFLQLTRMCTLKIYTQTNTCSPTHTSTHSPVLWRHRGSPRHRRSWNWPLWWTGWLQTQTYPHTPEVASSGILTPAWERACVDELLLSLRTKKNHAALTLSTLFKPLRRLLISFSSSVMLERHGHRHHNNFMCSQEWKSGVSCATFDNLSSS